MNIAIVGPSPKPYTIGGMEYLLLGIYEHINKSTIHKAELIKLPTDESTFWDLINSYKQFYKLDLSHFDLVITTKYPAWMLKHPNQVCYMAHRLRGLYDMYHLTNLPLDCKSSNPFIKQILDYIKNKSGSIDGLFSLLDQLYEVRDQIPKEYFQLPAPFIRNIIYYLDDKALSKENIKCFCAISNTVKNRKEYFPNGADVEVIYPPSFLPNFRNNDYEYLFTMSRLDNAKRVSLLIESMKYVDKDIKLKIAGTGPDELELKKIASNDKRIEFLGFINDDEAIEYYSNALAVPYLPYEEDYGLVTIEAMMSYKPVLTCNDSGGTNEFVEQGINGFISNPKPSDIARYINTLCNMSKDDLILMGKNAHEKVKSITWESTITKLIGFSGKIGSRYIPKKLDANKRKKIVVTSTFPIYPPNGGGQSRIFNLYKNIAKEYDVEVVSFTSTDDKYFSDDIYLNMRETRIPKSQLHQIEEWKTEKRIGIPVTDITMPKNAFLTEKYGLELERAIKESDIAVISHPYLLYEAQRYLNNKPFIYDAQDVEYIIKEGMLPKCKESEVLLKTVYDIERECCIKSKFIMTCSEEDRQKISEIYEVSIDKIVVIPNGADTKSIKFTNMEERLKNKKRLGLEKEKLALFMGSWHKPNLDACEYIFKYAEKTLDIKYLLVGSQCLYFKNKKIPSNIGLLGVIEDNVKQAVFDIVDVALNPMMSGSGTNLKMFDYMAAGIPILTTEFGARGIDNKDCFVVSPIDTMDRMIYTTLGRTDLNIMVNGAREYVEGNFEWNAIANILLQKIADI